MAYAEAAQREGVRDLAPRPARVPPPPGFYMPPPEPFCHQASLAETFATLSRCVRQAVLLEARLDSGACDHPLHARAPVQPAPKPSAPAPAREPGDATRLEHDRLEDDLAADANRPADEILAEICQKLGQTLENCPASPTRLPTPTVQRRREPPAVAQDPAKPTRPPDRRPPKPG